MINWCQRCNQTKTYTNHWCWTQRLRRLRATMPSTHNDRVLSACQEDQLRPTTPRTGGSSSQTCLVSIYPLWEFMATKGSTRRFQARRSTRQGWCQSKRQARHIRMSLQRWRILIGSSSIIPSTNQVPWEAKCQVIFIKTMLNLWFVRNKSKNRELRGRRTCQRISSRCPGGHWNKMRLGDLHIRRLCLRIQLAIHLRRQTTSILTRSCKRASPLRK